MKEKITNIDILEEDVKNILNCCIDIETLISLEKRAKEDLKNDTHNIQQHEVLTIIREFIRCKNDFSNLIAENKELKEEKQELQKYMKEYLIPKSAINLIYIPKSKVEVVKEKIMSTLRIGENVPVWKIVMTDNFLQSLLGKE